MFNEQQLSAIRRDFPGLNSEIDGRKITYLDSCLFENGSSLYRFIPSFKLPPTGQGFCFDHMAFLPIFTKNQGKYGNLSPSCHRTTRN